MEKFCHIHQILSFSVQTLSVLKSLKSIAWEKVKSWGRVKPFQYSRFTHLAWTKHIGVKSVDIQTHPTVHSPTSQTYLYAIC